MIALGIGAFIALVAYSAWRLATDDTADEALSETILGSAGHVYGRRTAADEASERGGEGLGGVHGSGDTL